jgi:hypothetical protein
MAQAIDADQLKQVIAGTLSADSNIRRSGECKLRKQRADRTSSIEMNRLAHRRLFRVQRNVDHSRFPTSFLFL